MISNFWIIKRCCLQWENIGRYFNSHSVKFTSAGLDLSISPLQNRGSNHETAKIGEWPDEVIIIALCNWADSVLPFHVDWVRTTWSRYKNPVPPLRLNDFGRLTLWMILQNHLHSYYYKLIDKSIWFKLKWLDDIGNITTYQKTFCVHQNERHNHIFISQ